MERRAVERILEDVRAGRLSVTEAVDALSLPSVEDLGFAKLDAQRSVRRRFGEVVLCDGKTPEQCVEILLHLRKHQRLAFGTRSSEAVVAMLRERGEQPLWFPDARVVALGEPYPVSEEARVAVVSAGTSDMPVAEEAAVTAQLLGANVERVYDVGVAGLQRVLEAAPRLTSSSAVIVVAGMDAALASVVAGLVHSPVVAVPTSVGYGAAFDGLSALLTMLNCCAPGVVVVNIDNGFGAGYYAALLVAQESE
ncbi:MAG: nickel pincer cofactor biosynthesis protein LarB [Armatimonadota bacterium]